MKKDVLDQFYDRVAENEGTKTATRVIADMYKKFGIEVLAAICNDCNEDGTVNFEPLEGLRRQLAFASSSFVSSSIGPSEEVLTTKDQPVTRQPSPVRGVAGQIAGRVIHVDDPVNAIDTMQHAYYGGHPYHSRLGKH